MALLLGFLLLLAACGGEADTAAGDDAAETAQTEAADTTGDTQSEVADDAGAAQTEAADDAAAATTVMVTTSDFGDILADGDGNTLYVFDNDEEGVSNCTGGCADTWPPLTGDVEAGPEVDAGLLGTVERDDGSTQVTYDGSPLYYYAADAEPGDINGQGVGDVWWVVGPDGQRITETAAVDGGGTGY
jgi:predicted lipoprotein with Yx(FWY)xxD motif